MMDKLAEIWAAKREHVAERKLLHPYEDLWAALPDERPRPFIQALRQKVADVGVGLIAEIKRASPSAGLIRADFNPPVLARAYAAGGAACLSVLTDTPFFQGTAEHLTAARTAVALPALRKDFVFDPYQIVEARVMRADAVLLIMAALSDEQAAELEATARDLHLDTLIEVHDEAELERALRLRSFLIGVNNRDLRTFQVDLGVTERLARLLPPDRLLVSESGIRTAADVARMGNAGVHCFLVGESLMRQADLAAATTSLLARTE